MTTREHDTTLAAREELGLRGINLTGHAYAWCERRGHYHTTNTYPALDNRITRYDLRPDVSNRHAMRMTLPSRRSDPQRRRGTRRMNVDPTFLAVLIRTQRPIVARLIVEGAGL